MIVEIRKKEEEKKHYPVKFNSNYLEWKTISINKNDKKKKTKKQSDSW